MNFVFLTGSADYMTSEHTDRRFFLVELPSSRPKSSLAAKFSREPEFGKFLASIGRAAVDEEAVASAIRDICEVSSRADLDRDPAAAARFEDRIVKPYADYCMHARKASWFAQLEKHRDR